MWYVRQLGTKTLKGHGFFFQQKKKTRVNRYNELCKLVPGLGIRPHGLVIRYFDLHRKREWIGVIEGINQQPWERISNWGTGLHNLM